MAVKRHGIFIKLYKEGTGKIEERLVGWVSKRKNAQKICKRRSTGLSIKYYTKEIYVDEHEIQAGLQGGGTDSPKEETETQQVNGPERENDVPTAQQGQEETNSNGGDSLHLRGEEAELHSRPSRGGTAE